MNAHFCCLFCVFFSLPNSIAYTHCVVNGRLAYIHLPNNYNLLVLIIILSGIFVFVSFSLFQVFESIHELFTKYEKKKKQKQIVYLVLFFLLIVCYFNPDFPMNTNICVCINLCRCDLFASSISICFFVSFVLLCFPFF